MLVQFFQHISIPSGDWRVALLQWSLHLSMCLVSNYGGQESCCRLTAEFSLLHLVKTDGGPKPAITYMIQLGFSVQSNLDKPTIRWKQTGWVELKISRSRTNYNMKLKAATQKIEFHVKCNEPKRQQQTGHKSNERLNAINDIFIILLKHPTQNY